MATYNYGRRYDSVGDEDNGAGDITLPDVQPQPQHQPKTQEPSLELLGNPGLPSLHLITPMGIHNPSPEPQQHQQSHQPQEEQFVDATELQRSIDLRLIAVFNALGTFNSLLMCLKVMISGPQRQLYQSQIASILGSVDIAREMVVDAIQIEPITIQSTPKTMAGLMEDAAYLNQILSASIEDIRTTMKSTETETSILLNESSRILAQANLELRKLFNLPNF